MSEQQFQPGDRVWFKLLGRVVKAYPDVNAITVDVDGTSHVIDLAATDVEMQSPVGWPPKLGDLWVAVNGRRWFAFWDGTYVVLIDKDGNRMCRADVNVNARHLTLVDREQQDGGGSGE